jgi:hypothetical protein
MRHSKRSARRESRRRKQSAKSTAFATISFLSLSLTGAAASDRSVFILDKDSNRLPGLRLAQLKRGGARRRGIRAAPGLRAAPGGRFGIRAGPGAGARRALPADKKRMGVGPGSSGFMMSVPATGPTKTK